MALKFSNTFVSAFLSPEGGSQDIDSVAFGQNTFLKILNGTSVLPSSNMKGFRHAQKVRFSRSKLAHNYPLKGNSLLSQMRWQLSRIIHIKYTQLIPVLKCLSSYCLITITTSVFWSIIRKPTANSKRAAQFSPYPKNEMFKKCHYFTDYN